MEQVANKTHKKTIFNIFYNFTRTILSGIRKQIFSFITSYRECIIKEIFMFINKLYFNNQVNFEVTLLLRSNSFI